MRLRRCGRGNSVPPSAQLSRLTRGTSIGQRLAKPAVRRTFTETHLAASCTTASACTRALRCTGGDEHNTTAGVGYEGSLSERFRFQDAPDDECSRARSLLVKLLKSRPYPAALLERKLQDKKFSADVIFWALQSVKEIGLQSDLAFAVDYARTKLLREKWALRKIWTEIRNKRISKVDADAAIDRVKREELESLAPDGADTQACAGGEDGDRARQGMHRLLVVAAEKQVAQMPGKPLVARQRHVAGYLGRRGHDYDTVLRVMTELGIGLNAEDDESKGVPL